MNIVVFGCDNSGKTTVSKLFDSILGGYVHSPGPLKDIESMKKFIEDNINKNPINIFDRFPIIEEYACGNVLRNNNLFSNEVEYSINTFDKIDLFIYCCPPIDIVTNWGDREQMEGIKDNVVGLREKYQEVYDFLKEHHYTVIKYDYTINGKYINYKEIDN